MMKLATKKIYSAVLIAAILSGCSSDDDDDEAIIIDDQKPYTEVILTATSNTDYVHFNLVSGTTVDSTDDWHIAFKRYNVKLGAETKGAIGDAQAEYYSSGAPVANAFVNATPLLEEPSLYNVLSETGLVFESNDVVPYIASSDWYIYNPGTHLMTANADNYWMLKSAEGNSYAKMHVSDITTGYVATFDFFTQLSGETQYSTTVDASFTVSMTTPGNTCFDFDSNAVVDCATSSAWDIQVKIASRSYITALNGGASGSGSATAYGPITLTEANTYAQASDVIAYAYATDQLGGVFNSYPWQEYAVTGEAGDHGIWPNYRVYVIDTDKNSTTDELIKLQVINYYNDAGASGYIKLRYMSLTDNGL